MDIQHKLRMKHEEVYSASKPLIDALAELKTEVHSIDDPKLQKVFQQKYENLNRALTNFISAL